MEVFDWNDKADRNEDQEGADKIESTSVTWPNSGRDTSIY